MCVQRHISDWHRNYFFFKKKNRHDLVRLFFSSRNFFVNKISKKILLDQAKFNQNEKIITLDCCYSLLVVKLLSTDFFFLLKKKRKNESHSFTIWCFSTLFVILERNSIMILKEFLCSYKHRRKERTMCIDNIDRNLWMN